MKLNTIRKTLYLYVNISNIWNGMKKCINFRFANKVYNQHKFKRLLFDIDTTNAWSRPPTWNDWHFNFIFSTFKKQTRISGGVQKITPTSLRYFGTHFFIFNLSLTTKQLCMIFYWHFLSPFFFTHLNWNRFVHRFYESMQNSINCCFSKKFTP